MGLSRAVFPVLWILAPILGPKKELSRALAHGAGGCADLRQQARPQGLGVCPRSRRPPAGSALTRRPSKSFVGGAEPAGAAAI